MGPYCLYLVLLWACVLPLAQQHGSPAAAAAAAAGTSGTAPQLRWPTDPALDDPWVRQHVALAYAAPDAQDGIGGQALRVLGIYATARALGLGFVHKQLDCIGHIGGVRNYHPGMSCSNLTAADARLMGRLRRLITLPTTAPEGSSSWVVRAVGAGQPGQAVTWNALLAGIKAAAAARQPTVLTLSAVIPFLVRNPDVFLAVPEMQPKALSNSSSAPAACRAGAGKPWLLGGLRIAVHLRRGDIRQQHKKHGHRFLPIDYYMNVLTALTKVLDEIGCDFAVEVFTEASNNSQELQALKNAVPQLTLLINTDLIWNWQMMATADLLLLSWSSYSFVAGLLNPDALHIVPPPAKGEILRLHMRHWHSVADERGTLPPEVLRAVRVRFGCNSSSQGHEQLQEQQLEGAQLLRLGRRAA